MDAARQAFFAAIRILISIDFAASRVPIEISAGGYGRFALNLRSRNRIHEFRPSTAAHPTRERIAASTRTLRHAF